MITTIRRRRRATILIAGLSLLIGAIVAGASAAGDTERITGYRIAAVLTDDGLLVTEVIDYDFGSSARRGIYRRIPDALPDSLTAFSPTAPDDALVSDLYYGAEIRVGDPSITIFGRHRYRIDYVLPFEAVVRDGRFSWDAIGTEWEVAIRDVEVALSLAGDLESPTCRKGEPWNESSCILAAGAGTGQFVTSVDHLDAGSGVTLSGMLVAGEPPSLFPAPPTDPVNDPGTGILNPFIAATAAAVLGGLAAAAITRRAGRERVWTGGAADAAFGDERDGLGSHRIDEQELAELATVEFEPPRDTSAVEGGLVLHEQVRAQHLSAWLLESAMRGEIELSGTDEPTITRGSAPAHPSVHQVLDGMFGSRSEITLDGYDSTFATGWRRLAGDLDDWLTGAAHWDAAGRRARRWAIGLGIFAGVVLMALTVAAAVVAARNGGAAALALVPLAALSGFAGGVVISSSELLVRTEAGTALWLRVESFRRFLENSEARHVTEAAEKGRLRQYTAWAVALGESKAWTAAVEDAAATDPHLRGSLANDLAFVTIGRHIASATTAATIAPVSSGGGGGFSGGVGGGGGGGGGGSW